MKKKFLAMALGIAVVLSCTACGGGSSDAAAPASGETNAASSEAGREENARRIAELLSDTPCREALSCKGNRNSSPGTGQNLRFLRVRVLWGSDRSQLDSSGRREEALRGLLFSV